MSRDVPPDRPQPIHLSGLAICNSNSNAESTTYRGVRARLHGRRTSVGFTLRYTVDVTLSPPVIALLAVLVLALVLLLVSERGRTGRRNRRRQHIATDAEARAEYLLTRLGYRITGRQVTRSWTLWVDDRARTATARADLLVSKNGQSFVAEVKTGAHASRPTQPNTRRQLLEYLHVFDVDGVLLVDMHRERVRDVQFDWAPPHSQRKPS